MAPEQAAVLPEQFAEMGQKSIKTMMGMQKGFLDAFQEINQQWISGVSAETALASEFFTKLASAKSIPDAAIAYQSCANRQMELLAESGRQFMAASEKMFPKFFGNGFSGAGA